MQLLMNGLIAGSFAALIAAGLALVYGVLGIFNLALGQMVLIGGYLTWWFHEALGLPFAVSIVAGCTGGALLSIVTYEVFVDPFYKRNRFLPLLTTIAWSMMLDALILLAFGESPHRILPSSATPLEILGARVSNEQGMLILATIAILSLVAFSLHSTRIGRQVRAVVQHDAAAMSLGIRAALLRRMVFVLSGILAAAGGIFIGIDQNLAPVLAFPVTIKAYAAVIAGGKGHLWGAILFAYIIAILEQIAVGVQWFGKFYISAGYQGTIALLFIIVFLLWRPQGLLGSTTRSA